MTRAPRTVHMDGRKNARVALALICGLRHRLRGALRRVGIGIGPGAYAKRAFRGRFVAGKRLAQRHAAFIGHALRAVAAQQAFGPLRAKIGPARQGFGPRVCPRNQRRGQRRTPRQARAQRIRRRVFGQRAHKEGRRHALVFAQHIQRGRKRALGIFVAAIVVLAAGRKLRRLAPPVRARVAGDAVGGGNGRKKIGGRLPFRRLPLGGWVSHRHDTAVDCRRHGTDPPVRGLCRSLFVLARTKAGATVSQGYNIQQLHVFVKFM